VQFATAPRFETSRRRFWFQKQLSSAAKSSPRAIELYAKSCDGNYGDGCWSLGAMYFNGTGTPRDVPRAVDIFLKACNLGSPLGCVNAGEAYRDGYGVAKDPENAKQLLKKSCSMGVRWGCDEYKKMP